MIRTVLISGNGECLSGGKELIASWQTSEEAFLWVDIESETSNAEIRLLKKLGCHQVAIEQSRKERRPPKIESFDNYTLILYRGIAKVNGQLDVTPLDISLFVGDRILISRHKARSHSIEHWMSAGDTLAKILKTPAELAIEIMHYSLDAYLENLIGFEETLSDIEDSLQGDIGSDDQLRDMVAYRSRLRKLNRIFNYHERIGAQLREDQYPFIDDQSGEIQHSIQNLHERCERLCSLGHMFYELCGDLIEGYLSITSHQLNQTMKILTVITAIFVPLSFLAGLYGMNFDNMPELHKPYGYFVLLSVMAGVTISLLTLFKKRGWL